MIATTRYGYMVADWKTPLSLGVQAFIEFNGYVINDRHQADRIRVYSITGIDGPDVTDVRESVPGDEGEFVYDGLYRGRTFVISGAIEAGSAGTCAQFERDLRAAYAPLVDAPMKFRWFDVFDGFDDPQTLQNYTVVTGGSGAASLIVTGGILRWPTTTPIVLMRSADNRLWGDVQLTQRLICGGYQDGSQVDLVMAMTDANDYLAVSFVNGATNQIQVVAVVDGTTHVLAEATTSSPLQGQSFWLRGRKDGDRVTVELWLEPPADSTLPDAFVDAFLGGSDADAFGDQVLSQVGFGAATTNTYWALDDFRVESMSPCDISFPVRTITKPSIQEQQQKKNTFARSFQLTLRAGKPYARCSTQSRSPTLAPSSGGTTQLGFSSPMTNPLSASTVLPGSVSLENNILSVRNRGTAPDRPLIVVYGAIDNFLIYNLSNSIQLNWSGSLADGDWLVIDCANRTIINSSGINMRQYLTVSDPRWMTLDPGWTDFYLTGAGYSGNTRMIAWSHARYI